MKILRAVGSFYSSPCGARLTTAAVLGALLLGGCGQGEPTAASVSVEPPAASEMMPGDSLGGSGGAPAQESDESLAPLDLSASGGARSDDLLPGGLPLGTATLEGTVWAPGNAPGMVPEDQEIPISGALVQVASEPGVEIHEGAQCQLCVPPIGRHTLTDPKGHFTLPELPAGDYWLSVRKGQFALEKQVTIVDGETRRLPDAETTLPSVHDPSSGAWVPRIALATGSFDKIEDILGKMGLGGVDAFGAWEATGAGADRVDEYDNGGERYSRYLGGLEQLVRDPAALAQYDIVFIPCSSVNTELLHDQAVLRNLREYVSLGGKLYVTDWSGSWEDNVFPAQTRFRSSEDTPASAYDPEANSWDLSQLAVTHGSTAYSSDDGHVVDATMREWLHGQVGPADASASPPVSFDADRFVVTGSYNVVEEVVPTTVGLDEDGMPVIDTPIVYVRGTTPTGADLPLTLTFQPAGCGRVLYSTYHTTDERHPNMVPQERILLYLIMEITVCRDEPVPVTPAVR